MSNPAAPASSPTGRPFADSVAAYAQAGWPCILPVPPDTKHPPPVGFTGAEGSDTEPMDLVRWVGSHPAHSVALRMPMFETWGVIGIDVDQYVKKGVQKRGAETLARLVEQHGPLPATWCSTARGTASGPGESRILLFRVPAQRYATALKATQPDGAETGDVEIIQRHHRYTVVWPSAHRDAGSIYRWYDPAGQPVDAPPKPDELTELPAAWVEFLASGATEQAAASADVASGQALLVQLLADERAECAEVTSARLTALDQLERADSGSRHDTMTARVHHLVQLAASGHPGAGVAFEDLRVAWSRLTAGEDRADELERALLTSARKAVTRVGTHQVNADPCLLVASGIPLPTPPAAGTPPGTDGLNDPELQVEEPPAWLGVREAIGTHAFDPNAGLDQPLAEAVLARMYPALRYAHDAGGWLLRKPQRWELYKSLSAWAVAQVAPLMPVGDPTAEKGSEPYERSKRRARFMTAAGAGAIAKMMNGLVAGGTHPASIALADLDSDPEILWAGGMPFSLRASLDGPTFAQVDTATPHQHTAGVLPELRPTPLWDAFLEAVWPDPAHRAWAIRVLSIAFTGYADRALPILLGETGRGKTQVVHLLMSLLGSYGHAADPRLMSEAGEKAHASIVYALKGRRLSFIDEGPREGRWAQERLKQLTGGGELTANQMNQNPITFRPTHTLVLTANDEPVLTDPAIRSRARLIPCDGDPELVRRARAAIGHVSGPAWRREAPGVLATMMAEAAAWLADPSTAYTDAAPEHLRFLAENLGAEQDPVAVWVTEETDPSEVGTPARELYQAFVASCRRNSMRADAIPSETKWGRSLTRLGIQARHTEHGKWRPLVIRSGGFLPGMGSATPTGQANPSAPSPQPVSPQTPDPAADGFHGSADGLLTGFDPQPVRPFPQVNPTESVTADGSDGFTEEVPHMCTPACAHETGGEFRSNPSADPSADQLELDLSEPAGEPRPAAKPRPKRATKPKSEAATAKAAQLRTEKRAAAIREASGATLELPALVTRDGAVRAISTTDADALLATITTQEAGELTVDVEHTGYPVGHEHFALRTVQLGGEHFAVDLDPTDPDQADVVRRHLAAAPILHAHSATADLVPLEAAGLVDRDDAWARMLDTAILAKLADPAMTDNGADLKKISKAVLGPAALSPPADEARAALFKAGKWLTETEVTTPVERSGWAQVDPRSETMIRYAGADVLDDAALARRLPTPPPAVLERERTAQRMTARMAHTGFRFDPEQIDRLHHEHSTARALLAERIHEAGIENPASQAQVGAALEAIGAPLPRTSTNKPSVAQAVLEPLRQDEGPVGQLAGLVLDWRHHDTALKLLLEPWRSLVRQGDGRARSTVYTLGADTGRMSSVRFNFQQISRAGGLRACITADPGWMLISADFAGVELRTAAGLSRDRDLAAIMDDPDRDLHWEVARLAFGPQATKADRYRIKRGVFGRIYGGGVKAVAAGVGVSDPVARQVIEAMDQLTPGLTEWSRLVRDGVESGRTQFQTYSGRTIHLPKRAPHAAPNYCIQGTARELLIDALLRWAKTPWGDCTLMPVHDELVVMVPEADADAATQALVECMTTDLYGVPIIAEASDPTFSWSDSV